jgi:hypothetical protein
LLFLTRINFFECFWSQLTMVRILFCLFCLHLLFAFLNVGRLETVGMKYNCRLNL